jgi:asparagine N-glycosylation enzyme membrane subunit Stt3
LDVLIDVTTGKYMPSDPDAIGILRYVRYVLENGSLMDIDLMRYFPYGYDNMTEFSLMSHLIVYFYKILHFFSPAVTIEFADVIYPAFAFVVALIFFYLLLRKVFDWRVASLGSLFLAILPSYLFRTMAGVSDKEAMAMIFLYVCMWAFISFFLEKKDWVAYVYGIVAGLSLGFMWAIWGGVNFVFLSVGAFVLILILLERLRARDLWVYGLFLLVSFLTAKFLFPDRVYFMALIIGFTSGMMYFAFIVGLFNYLIFEKDYLKIKSKFGKLHTGLVSILIVLGLGFLIFLVAYGPDFIVERVSDVYIDLVEPFGRNRWALTVAESQQPYFTDWMNNFSWKFLLVVFGGALVLAYEMFKGLQKKTYYLISAYGAFILAFSLNRYSSSSNYLNGETNFAIFLYIGSLILFGIYLLYELGSLWRSNKEEFIGWTSKINLGYLFISVFFIFTLVGARSAVRLLFLFTPAVAILGAVFLIFMFDYAKKIQDQIWKYGIWIALGIVTFFFVWSFYENTYNQGISMGTGYTSQWQYGMDWVRNNTPEDAVFAHWWDYGYYVQTGGERATLSDGGNANPTVNHLLGRHLLMADNDTEALEFLLSRNATHVLAISDEIGKYGAFASIGSDGNYDRFSYLTVYGLDSGQTQETRDGINLVYTGGMFLEEDYVYEDVLYPAYSAGVVGFAVPTLYDENGTFKQFDQPYVVIASESNYVQVPLKCLYFSGQEIIFEDGKFDACLQIIPTYSGGSVNPFGAGLYLTPRIYGNWFAQHYLFGESNEYFKLVYSDEASVPLMVYEGRIVGPLKIWEISYPSDLVIPEEYYMTSLPEDVQRVIEIN